MKKLFFSIMLILPYVMFSQGLYNNGANIVIASGGNIYIDGGTNGDYTNANGGTIDIDGKLILEGDFTNNAANTVFTSVGTDGEVVFAGGTQTITAAIPNFVNFEKVTINNGSTVNVLSGSGITTNGDLAIAGTLDLKCNGGETPTGSLIVGSGLSGAGTINVERYYKVNGRWQYISVPMNNITDDYFDNSQNSHPFNANLYYYQESFVAGTNPPDNKYSTWVDPQYNLAQAWYNGQVAADGSTNTLSGETGYITYNETDLDLTFSGTYDKLNNNATYTHNTSYTSGDGALFEGWNLIGNPYPCAIDWTALSLSNVKDAVYLWDGDNGNYVYYGTAGDHVDYADKTVNSDGNARYIPAMQSFFVKASGAGSVKIEKADRVHSANNMYKGNDNTLQTPNNSFIKLRTEFNGYFDETVVRFVDNSTTSLDDEDMEKMFAYTPPLLYSFANNNSSDIPLAINSLPIPNIDENYMIPLGFVAKADGDYTIKAKDLNNLDFSAIYLIDNQDASNPTYIDLLKDEQYTFYATENEYYDRFYLFVSPNATDIEDVVLDGNSNVKIYSFDKTVYLSIPNLDDTNGNVDIFDALGRRIYSNVANSTLNEYDLNFVASGTYFVKYRTAGNLFSQKVILK